MHVYTRDTLVPRMRNNDITLRDFADATYNTEYAALHPAFASRSLSEHVIPTGGLITVVSLRSYIIAARDARGDVVVNAKSRVRLSEYELIKSRLKPRYKSGEALCNQFKMLENKRHV